MDIKRLFLAGIQMDISNAFGLCLWQSPICPFHENIRIATVATEILLWERQMKKKKNHRRESKYLHFRLTSDLNSEHNIILLKLKKILFFNIKLSTGLEMGCESCGAVYLWKNC